MKSLKFERIAQLIAVAAINKDNTTMTKIGVKEQELEIKFSDYVKSQIHLNIVGDLFDRTLAQYAKTLYFLKGNNNYRKDALQVLKYFYSDMSHFLINNPNNVRLHIIIDGNFRLDEIEVDYAKTRSDLKKTLDAVLQGQALNAVISFGYNDIFDDVENLDDACLKLDSYTLAAILKHQILLDNPKRIKWSDEYEYKVK